jgi:hypothetical protein
MPVVTLSISSLNHEFWITLLSVCHPEKREGPLFPADHFRRFLSRQVGIEMTPAMRLDCDKTKESYNPVLVILEQASLHCLS